MVDAKSNECSRIYERCVKYISKGQLPNSVKEYILQNKSVVNERIPKAYCWNYDCERFAPCDCKVSFKSLANYITIVL